MRLCGHCGDIHATPEAQKTCDDLHGGHVTTARLPSMSRDISEDEGDGDWSLPGNHGCFVTNPDSLDEDQREAA